MESHTLCRLFALTQEMPNCAVVAKHKKKTCMENQRVNVYAWSTLVQRIIHRVFALSGKHFTIWDSFCDRIFKQW